MRILLNTIYGLNCLKLIRDIHCGINGILLHTGLTPLDIVNMIFAQPLSSVPLVGANPCYNQIEENLTMNI